MTNNVVHLLTLEPVSLQLLPVRWLPWCAVRGVAGDSVRVGGRWRVRTPHRPMTREPVDVASWWKVAPENCKEREDVCG